MARKKAGQQGGRFEFSTANIPAGLPLSSADEVGACLIGGQTKPFCGGFGGFLKGQGAPADTGQRVAALPQERRGWGKRRQGKGHRVITSCMIYTGSA